MKISLLRQCGAVQLLMSGIVPSKKEIIVSEMISDGGCGLSKEYGAWRPYKYFYMLEI